MLEKRTLNYSVGKRLPARSVHRKCRVSQRHGPEVPAYSIGGLRDLRRVDRQGEGARRAIDIGHGPELDGPDEGVQIINRREHDMVALIVDERFAIGAAGSLGKHLHHSLVPWTLQLVLVQKLDRDNAVRAGLADGGIQSKGILAAVGGMLRGGASAS